jgi:hypothetical protein
MSFMINGWNVPHHVLNDYCSKQLVHHFVIYDCNSLVINSIIYVKISSMCMFKKFQAQYIINQKVCMYQMNCEYKCTTFNN